MTTTTTVTATATATAATTSTDIYMPPRLLAPGGAPAGFSTHEQRYGPVAHGDPAQLLRTLAESGLTGRGGAAFPTYRKLVSVAEAGRRTGRTPVVVANGAEGEPASAKDKTLLRLSPHLVLDGLQLVAELVGAGRRISRSRTTPRPSKRRSPSDATRCGCAPYASRSASCPASPRPSPSTSPDTRPCRATSGPRSASRARTARRRSSRTSRRSPISP